MIDRASQWAADQQLTECLRYAGDNGLSLSRMREALRPKPPSLKQEALKMLDFMESEAPYDKPMIDTIRHALELLPDDTTP
jgi:chromosome segregation and condensation protein ScpB